MSIVGYFVAVALSFFKPSIAFAVYVLIAVMWLIPDRRIERKLITDGPP
jgi:hypothetical protein